MEFCVFKNGLPTIVTVHPELREISCCLLLQYQDSLYLATFYIEFMFQPRKDVIMYKHYTSEDDEYRPNSFLAEARQ